MKAVMWCATKNTLDYEGSGKNKQNPKCKNQMPHQNPSHKTKPPFPRIEMLDKYKP